MSAPTPAILAGRRVVDASSMIAGPYAAMVLGDLGADVVKVEPLSGDPARQLGPPVVGEDSAAFHSVNRNKRNVCLDLTTEAGRERLDRLLATADVLVHNSLPRVAAGLGLLGDELVARHPRLVVVEIGGFSPNGAEADRPAYDIIIAAMSGLMSVTGERDGRPLRPGAPMIDVSTGAYAAMGALAALLQREQTGHGQVVSVNMIDVAVNLQATNFSYHFATEQQPPRMANGSYFAVSNCFQTADSWIAVAVGTDSLWRRLVDALDLEELATPAYATNQERLRRAPEIEERLTAAFRTRPTGHWVRVLAEHKVPHAQIQDYEQVVEYARAHGHDLFWSFERDDTGVVPVVGNPLRFGSGPLGVHLPPPRLRAGTDPVADTEGGTS